MNLSTCELKFTCDVQAVALELAAGCLKAVLAHAGGSPVIGSDPIVRMPHIPGRNAKVYLIDVDLLKALTGVGHAVLF